MRFVGSLQICYISHSNPSGRNVGRLATPEVDHRFTPSSILVLTVVPSLIKGVVDLFLWYLGVLSQVLLKCSDETVVYCKINGSL